MVGASSGIGRATAHLYAGQGAQLVLAARSESSLREVQGECRALGAKALVVPTDVRDRSAVEALVRAAVARFGRIDVCVDSAAVIAYGRFEDVPGEIFDQVVATGLLGVANVARAVLPQMASQAPVPGRPTRVARGSLVVVGSLLGHVATPYMSSYVTTKWGVHGLVRALEIEARATPGVSVSLVSPGGVDTPIYRQAGNFARREGRPPPPVDPPEKVARAILQVAERPRREKWVGVGNPLVIFGFVFTPALFDRLVTPLMSVLALSRRPIEDWAGNVTAPRPEGNAVHGMWRRWGGRVASREAGGKTAARA